MRHRGVVAALLGVAGGELLIPTFVLLFAVDRKLAGSLSLLVSPPRMLVASFATAETRRSSLWHRTSGSCSRSWPGP